MSFHKNDKFSLNILIEKFSIFYKGSNLCYRHQNQWKLNQTLTWSEHNPLASWNQKLLENSRWYFEQLDSELSNLTNWKNVSKLYGWQELSLLIYWNCHGLEIEQFRPFKLWKLSSEGKEIEQKFISVFDEQEHVIFTFQNFLSSCYKIYFRIHHKLKIIATSHKLFLNMANRLKQLAKYNELPELHSTINSQNNYQIINAINQKVHDIIRFENWLDQKSAGVCLTLMLCNICVDNFQNCTFDNSFEINQRTFNNVENGIVFPFPLVSLQSCFVAVKNAQIYVKSI